MKKVPALTVGDSSVMRKIVDLPWQRTVLQIVETLEASNRTDRLAAGWPSGQEGEGGSLHLPAVRADSTF